jgi:amino acid transporter
VVSPARLQANSPSALVYVAQALGGGTWEKIMALALALSSIASTSIVVGARIIYGMAGYRALPGFLAHVPRRFPTPAAASVVFGFLVIALGWVYILATSVHGVQVAGRGHAGGALVDVRYRRGRPGADAARPVRAALPVLLHPAGERPAVTGVR